MTITSLRIVGSYRKIIRLMVRLNLKNKSGGDGKDSIVLVIILMLNV
jgi:hypothetical protein